MPSPAARPDARLRLLTDVSWDGAPLPGGRGQALLAALADAEGRVVGEGVLVDEVWGDDDAPANPTKAIQVVVSRVRAQTAPGVVERAEHGYRLGVDPDHVDAIALRRHVGLALAAAGRGDWMTARDAARAALSAPRPADGGEGAVAALRADARHRRGRAESVLGLALSALGDHAEALPLLEAADASGLDDEAGAVALLRSLAAVRGVPAALERYDALRRDLADRLGLDPGPRVRALHTELLAADAPVRSGLRHDPTSLVGRDEDIRALRAAVRESRVVSILGAGGLGKTRLANLLAREAEQPVVHVVELVGVASPDDVVGEVGSSLGVRDSVSGRRVLTPEQRGDLRARAAQTLDRAPTLLVLDNCEHVVGAVADLVAYLVATCPLLRVVTTTRAPLAIAAERVFPLAQLDDDAAAELFAQRARAARPGVTLDDAAVRRVVARLDGLPLAVELAAARVRAMSVEDVARRLDDRFALLRGTDRSAPDRHQTLLAVIDWSWNLLGDPERRALRRLSVFHDGFSLDAAGSVLGHDALPEVQALVDQSLLTVLEREGAVRYRMLETVREFGRTRLREAGEEAGAEAALRGWACAFADRLGTRLWSRGQVGAVGELAVEENNLADVLRAALTVPDPVTATRVLATLAGFWTVRGENLRVIGLTGALDDALGGWQPAPDEVAAAVGAAALVALNTGLGELGDSRAGRALLDRFGDDSPDPRVRAVVAVLHAQDATDPEGMLAALDAVGESGERTAAVLARLWAAHHRENAGDAVGALREAELGIARVHDDDGPWLGALLHTVLASLNAQLGRLDEVLGHALVALPVLDRLDATDDAIQTRTLLAVHAMSGGDLAGASRWIDEVEVLGRRRPGFGGAFVTATARAELALARGDLAEGLELYRGAARELAALTLPGLRERTGLEPWALFGESAAVTAHALHGTGAEGADLHSELLAKAHRVLDADRPRMDYPVAGLVLHALGTWALVRDTASPQDAVRLLVLAECFAYPRFTPTMSPDRTNPVAEDRVPGLTSRLRAEYGGRTAPDLLPEARAAVEAVRPRGHILRA